MVRTMKQTLQDPSMATWITGLENTPSSQKESFRQVEAWEDGWGGVTVSLSWLAARGIKAYSSAPADDCRAAQGSAGQRRAAHASLMLRVDPNKGTNVFIISCPPPPFFYFIYFCW